MDIDDHDQTRGFGWNSNWIRDDDVDLHHQQILDEEDIIVMTWWASVCCGWPIGLQQASNISSACFLSINGSNFIILSRYELRHSAYSAEPPTASHTTEHHISGSTRDQWETICINCMSHLLAVSISNVLRELLIFFVSSSSYSCSHTTRNKSCNNERSRSTLKWNFVYHRFVRIV